MEDEQGTKLQAAVRVRRQPMTLEFDLDQGLILTSSTGESETFYFADIVGVRTVSAKRREPNHSFFQIYSYPKAKSCNSIVDGQKRCARHITVEIDESEGREVLAAQEWVEKIRQVLWNARDTRKILIFVNPASGQGRGRSIFQVVVQPMLEQAAVLFDVIFTERAGHARDTISNSTNLEEYRAVATVSGDGLLSEVIQGMSSRSDSSTIFQKMPIGIVCAGSGNGLCKSVLFASGEAYGTLAATFVLIKGKPKRLDLSRVITPENSEGYLSFLCMGWAIVSDVDIESERLRCLGSARFTIGALQRILFLRDYPGRLSYLPASNSNPTLQCNLPLSEALSDNWVILEGRFVMLWICQTSHAAHDMFTSPNSTLDDGIFTILLLRRPVTRLALLSMFLAIEQGTHLEHPNLQVIQAKAYRLEPQTREGLYSLDGEIIEYGPVHAYIEPGFARVISL